jgi:hypothetical protein
VVYLCYHLKIEVMTKRKEVSKIAIMNIVNRINEKNKPIFQRFPRIAALISNPGASSAIAKVVRKVTAGNNEVHRTSIDAEAAKIRAMMADQDKGQHAETSIDQEKKKLSGK